MFLGQSDDASVEPKERPTKSPIRLLRGPTHHQRMDAANKRDAGNISCNDQAKKAGDIVCRYSVRGPTTG
jgi:hypothetical protein